MKELICLVMLNPLNYIAYIFIWLKHRIKNFLNNAVYRPIRRYTMAGPNRVVI